MIDIKYRDTWIIKLEQKLKELRRCVRDIKLVKQDLSVNCQHEKVKQGICKICNKVMK